LSAINWNLVTQYYFDHNATSPVAPGVLQSLVETMAEVPGNASSIHYYGQVAKRKLEGARRMLAGAVNCDPKDLVFTSGGTESDNLAIFGVARRARALNGHAHVVTSAIEHPAVLNACTQLEAEGVALTVLPVDGVGRIDPVDVKRALRPDTCLVTIHHANNEIGTIEPIAKLAKAAREGGALFHTDAVQTVGRIPVDIHALGVDLMTIGGHKCGGPKGVGALYIRKGIELAPLLYGGHHERDRRAGTENVPGAVALATAVSTCTESWSRIAELRDRLERGILARVPAVGINGDPANRMPNTTNIAFEGIGGESMVIALDLRGFSVSSGSACSSGAVEPSHVLLALGLDRDQARSCIRFSLGPSNTFEQVDALIDAVAACADHLRRVSTSSVGFASIPFPAREPMHA
jgi:cysteine desulfurase